MTSSEINIPDTVFTSFFNDKKRLIELYNALEDKSCPLDAEARIIALENAIYIGRRNNLSLLLGGKRLIHFELMSSISQNLPLRMFIIVGRLFRLFCPSLDDKPIQLPSPTLIALYDGEAEFPDREEMNFSDMLQHSNSPGAIKLKVTIYNINQGRNPDIMQRSKSLCDYSAFVGMARRNLASNLPPHEAVSETVRQCIDSDIMKDFLLKNRSEAESMLFAEFDVGEALKARYEDGFEDGFADAKKETAKAALAQGASPSFVAAITGLSQDIVEKMILN